MSFQVVFPMAGFGTRFGENIFKPFLLATEETFIELAIKPFLPFNPEFYFIYRSSQEKTYQVSQRLQQLFPSQKIHTIVIEEDTKGPLQTIQAAKLPAKPSFVCDCDHSIDITPMIEELAKNQDHDVIIPFWNIEEKEYKHWGKVQLNPITQEITAFAEKEYLSNAKGLIGCYYFKDISVLSKYPAYENISDALRCMHQDKKRLKTIQITSADFFGTPEALQTFRFNRAKKHTFFIDIDGTLLNQITKEVLPGSVEQLQKWKEEGHLIVLTTASANPKIPSDIPYDQLITNLTPGRRIILNDKKPYMPYYEMATAYNFPRNKGIRDLQISSNTPKIVATFPGASFAKVYLVEDENGVQFIRKYADNQTILLERQYEDLQRLSYYAPNIFPQLLASYKTHNYYYYDMEYYPNHKPLSTFRKDIQYKIIKRVLNDLTTTVYVFSRPVTNKKEWIKEFIAEKIVPKKKLIQSIYPETELYNIIATLDLVSFAPDAVSPIHGDLTLENILYDLTTDTYKLIDPAGARYVDAKEMDIGKLFQSLLTDYRTWSYATPEQLETMPFIMKDYTEVKDIVSEDMYKKGVFYMATYFIRMTPFMLEKSKQHVKYMLRLAENYIKLLH